MPERRTRALRPGRRFDLRSTAMFFGLLAAALVIGGLAVRALAGVVERRPVWAVVLLCLGLAVAVARGRRRRRLSAAGVARQAGRAFARGTSTALDALDAPAPPPVSAPPVIPAQAGPVDEVTSPLPVAQGIDHEALTPDEFEAATAELCARDGCTEVQVVGGAGDLGADVTALTPDGRRLVVQCKRYGEDNKVGSQDLQRFGGTCFTVHEADLAVVVTTGEFTVPALEYAEQCGIVCVDGDGLLAWSQGRAEAPWAAVREETA